jgi:hypothetical protein
MEGVLGQYNLKGVQSTVGLVISQSPFTHVTILFAFSSLIPTLRSLMLHLYQYALYVRDAGCPQAV